jgi:hypothetical protein
MTTCTAPSAIRTTPEGRRDVTAADHRGRSCRALRNARAARRVRPREKSTSFGSGSEARGVLQRALQVFVTRKIRKPTSRWTHDPGTGSRFKFVFISGFSQPRIVDALSLKPRQPGKQEDIPNPLCVRLLIDSNSSSVVMRRDQSQARHLSTCGLMLTMTGMIFYFHFNASGSRRKSPECTQEDADHGAWRKSSPSSAKRLRGSRWSIRLIG